jgi:hypothetical protein
MRLLLLTVGVFIFGSCSYASNCKGFDRRKKKNNVPVEPLIIREPTCCNCIWRCFRKMYGLPLLII